MSIVVAGPTPGARRRAMPGSADLRPTRRAPNRWLTGGRLRITTGAGGRGTEVRLAIPVAEQSAAVLR